MKRFLLFPAMLLTAASLIVSKPARKEMAGPLSDGGFLLVSGWKIRAAGRQVPVDTFPMSAVESRDGRHLLVLNGGYRPPSVSVIDTKDLKEISRVPVKDGWLGLALSADGQAVWVGGGQQGTVTELAFRGGALTEKRTLSVSKEPKSFVGDVALAPDGRTLYATNLYHDSIFRLDLESGNVRDRIPTGRRPYRIVFHPDGQSFLVSSWADNVVLRHDIASGKILDRVDAGAHPTDMLWEGGRRLFVAAANTNYVAVLDADMKVIEKINISMTPRQPLGMTPSALALAGGRLYVVCSDANAVAVADVSKEKSRVLGFIPTGWYPTGVRVLGDGRLAILNGRGLRSFPNLHGPQPQRVAIALSTGTPEVQYVARMQTGTVGVLDAPGDRQLAAYTKTVTDNSPYRDKLLDRVETGRNNPVPSRPGEATPIRHVVYIIKENRTYDQVLGDLEKGNGDKSLVLFGEKVTPNQHKLAREFVLLDNFYVSADVSADGHNWSMAAIAPDFTQKVWPNGYRKSGLHAYLGGLEPAAQPPNGYLWTLAHAAGVSIRNYGYLGVNRKTPAEDGTVIEDVRDPILKPVTALNYHAYDLNHPDLGRAEAFLRDLAEWEKKGEWPRFILMRLGNNHTMGTTPGRLSPVSLVADNDAALGRIVEGISKSRFWANTAIFVLEDDAQNGPDHVDSHRSPAFLISPYVRRGAIDSTMYNTTSMLRTMELILGLGPMTHFDAAARPMSAAFTATPDLRPFTAEAPRVPLTERNPQRSATAARSLKMDFSEADLIDDDELNDILWTAIRGTPPPAPVRSYFGR